MKLRGVFPKWLDQSRMTYVAVSVDEKHPEYKVNLRVMPKSIPAILFRCSVFAFVYLQAMDRVVLLWT